MRLPNPSIVSSMRVLFVRLLPQPRPPAVVAANAVLHGSSRLAAQQRFISREAARIGRSGRGASAM